MDTRERLVGEIKKKYASGELKVRRYESEDEKSIRARIPEPALRYGGKTELVPGIMNVPPRYLTRKQENV